MVADTDPVSSSNPVYVYVYMFRTSLLLLVSLSKASRHSQLYSVNRYHPKGFLHISASSKCRVCDSWGKPAALNIRVNISS